MKIKIINTSNHALPSHATPLSAGMDLRANLIEPVSLTPLKPALIPTGLFIQLPEGYEGQIRPRSGLALKHGVTVLNSPGTIDADFRHEVKVLLINHSAETFIIQDGDRIAQLVVAKHERVEWQIVSELEETERKGGFGHTGIN